MTKKKELPFKSQKMTIIGNKIECPIDELRKEWLKDGYELVNITTLCEFKLGTTGCCNEINFPEETLHHIQCMYRDECIAVFQGKQAYVIDDTKYLLHYPEADDLTGSSFILYRKVKTNE